MLNAYDLHIAIVTTARQIPAECENRTIFPLLAKPVTRNQVVLGKFGGCWLATGIALIVFYLFFTIVAGTRENQWPIMSYLQALWLQWMMLAIVIALTLLGSIVFAAPSSNSTICFVVVIGILLVGGHLDQVALHQPQPVQSIAYAVFFLIPHLEWYDVRQLVFFEQGLVPWGACAIVVATPTQMIHVVAAMNGLLTRSSRAFECRSSLEMLHLYSSREKAGQRQIRRAGAGMRDRK